MDILGEIWSSRLTHTLIHGWINFNTSTSSLSFVGDACSATATDVEDVFKSTTTIRLRLCTFVALREAPSKESRYRYRVVASLLLNIAITMRNHCALVSILAAALAPASLAQTGNTNAKAFVRRASSEVSFWTGKRRERLSSSILHCVLSF
jgi:hypothetical protein